MRRIRTGIVGLQSVYWPDAFANCLKSISVAELVACTSMSVDPGLISISLGKTPEEYADQYGIRLYHDSTEMIQKEGLDAVCICAKHTEIVNFIEQVAPLGVDIYIAKPMATTLEAADRIVKAVRNNNLIATSGTTERFDGGIREAYQRFKSGTIGELISIRALHQHGNINGFPKGDWYWDEEQGGPELSLIWYAADIVRWFADSEVVRVYAEYDNYLSENSPFMDNGKVILRFENRVIGSIDIYFSVEGFQFPSYEIELVGTTGGIRTQQSVYEGTLFTSEGVSNFYRTQNNNLLDEMRHWVQCCIDKTNPELAIEDARRVIELCLATRQSARMHTPIALP
ncbi:MAG: Gfo/Idh/MocA family oxidoreductase [Candidatus Poribacteria bacterium]|nr:Gfo/Idh/MocA family oxidoreductase [Candidatus Poribacteria bacterium]